MTRQRDREAMAAQCALVVIDVQQAFCEGEHEAFQIARVIERINALADKARRASAPVVFIQHQSEDGLLRRGSRGWRLATELFVAPGDAVLAKSTPDSFLGTDLAPFLEERGIESLVICGLQSEYCVDTTTRRALALGYPVVLVADAHTTVDAEHLSAAQIIRHHNETLSSISSFGPRARAVASADVDFAGRPIHEGTLP